SLEKKRKNITYYALDLMKHELIKSLKSLGSFSNIKLIGLWGTFEDGIDFTATLSNDKPKAIIFLGTTIGNFSREDATNFLRHFQTKAMGPGDLFLLGIDKRNSLENLTIAYNNPPIIEFHMNGLDNINTILDQPFINRNNFDYFTTYNEDKGRVEIYYRSKRDQILEYMPINEFDKKIQINVQEGELILSVHSYKYNELDLVTLFYKSNLAHVKTWTDSNLQY
ncbi:15778_t:CDS:1, partial [Racocetra fulgida]